MTKRLLDLKARTVALLRGVPAAGPISAAQRRPPWTCVGGFGRSAELRSSPGASSQTSTTSWKRPVAGDVGGGGGGGGGGDDDDDDDDGGGGGGGGGEDDSDSGDGDDGNDGTGRKADGSLSQVLSQDTEGDDGDPVYIVDRLVARYAKLSGGLRTVFYFVKWQQYGRSYDSWEPRDNLLQLDALRQFEQQHGQIDRNDDGCCASDRSAASRSALKSSHQTPRPRKIGRRCGLTRPISPSPASGCWTPIEIAPHPPKAGARAQPAAGRAATPTTPPPTTPPRRRARRARRARPRARPRRLARSGRRRRAWNQPLACVGLEYGPGARQFAPRDAPGGHSSRSSVLARGAARARHQQALASRDQRAERHAARSGLPTHRRGGLQHRGGRVPLRVARKSRRPHVRGAPRGRGGISRATDEAALAQAAADKCERARPPAFATAGIGSHSGGAAGGRAAHPDAGDALPGTFKHHTSGGDQLGAAARRAPLSSAARAAIPRRKLEMPGGARIAYHGLAFDPAPAYLREPRRRNSRLASRRSTGGTRRRRSGGTRSRSCRSRPSWRPSGVAATRSDVARRCVRA